MSIALIGAYGYTGQLIGEQLNQKGIHFSMYGRDSAKLMQVQAHWPMVKKAVAIDLRKEEQVNDLLRENEILINCAGPFTEEGKILLQKCAEQGKKYFDITGEIGFVKSSYEQNHTLAKETGALIVHACAFESIVVDLMMQLLDRKKKIQSVQTFYHFNQKKSIARHTDDDENGKISNPVENSEKIVGRK